MQSYMRHFGKLSADSNNTKGSWFKQATCSDSAVTKEAFSFCQPPGATGKKHGCNGIKEAEK